MDSEITVMKPYTLVYRTSLEKWEMFRRFAVMNNLPTDNINALIAKIKEVGDASSSRGHRFLIESRSLYVGAVYNGDKNPCPHCLLYRNCHSCPLYDDDGLLCCSEWRDVSDEAELNYIRMPMGTWPRI